MVAARRQNSITVEAYLAFERESAAKHEYWAGEVRAMAGAKRNHNLITANVVTLLNTQLRSRSCEVYASDMRVKTPTDLIAYPDVVVVCDAPVFFDSQNPDTLLNPTVLIEVLSPSTEAFDRGRKFAHYRTIAALRTYLLIAQDEAHIECYVRDGERWILSDTIGLESTVNLAAIDCHLPLTEVYRKVEFLPDAPA